MIGGKQCCKTKLSTNYQVEIFNHFGWQGGSSGGEEIFAPNSSRLNRANYVTIHFGEIAGWKAL